MPADLSDDQDLEGLLALNLERAAGEVAAAKTTRPMTSRSERGGELI